MGYTPDRAARALRTRRSAVIALIVADIENPFFTSLARGVEDVAQPAGYSVLLCNTDEDPQREQAALQVALSERMSGVLLVPAADGSPIEPLLERRVPVVTVDRSLHHHPVDSVVVDNLAGAVRRPPASTPAVPAGSRASPARRRSRRPSCAAPAGARSSAATPRHRSRRLPGARGLPRRRRPSSDGPSAHAARAAGRGARREQPHGPARTIVLRNEPDPGSVLLAQRD
ncbi:hypothetical protein [Pseudonocardia thermophila]|jgi:Transcriptional regulators|uniref:hypothetical protein n=1 Tax=Pseudonocardia thermophila TaxID=1848 RepID=UPI00248EB3C4|nr:hypothetical protein [Pseudonocardia thermophila]